MRLAAEFLKSNFSFAGIFSMVHVVSNMVHMTSFPLLATQIDHYAPIDAFSALYIDKANKMRKANSILTTFTLWGPRNGTRLMGSSNSDIRPTQLESMGSRLDLG